jgi:hypothetical protein
MNELVGLYREVTPKNLENLFTQQQLEQLESRVNVMKKSLPSYTINGRTAGLGTVVTGERLLSDFRKWAEPELRKMTPGPAKFIEWVSEGGQLWRRFVEQWERKIGFSIKTGRPI